MALALAHSVVELMVVLENLASGGRRGESCDSGAASTVVARELLVWFPSVRLLEGWADGGSEDAQWRVWWCLSSRASTVPGMTLKCPGWPQRAGSDGGNAPCWPDVTAPSQAGAE
jgi:hypothetical protein